MAPPQHFFRVVSDPLDQGIRIPALFMRRYGGFSEKGVILRVPDGVEWRVESRKIDGETWLQKGWKEFGEYYSIKDYYFLVFKYEGNSCFHVTIFDTTASEIYYPVKFSDQCRREEVKVEVKSEEDSDDDLVEILEVKGSKKREHADRILRRGIHQNLVLSYTTVNGRRLRKRNNSESGEGTSRASPQSSKPAANSKLSLKRQRTVHETESRSEYPFFEFSVQKSHISTPFFVTIPSAFVRDNLERNFREEFNMRVPGEKKTWPLRIRIDERQGKISGDGWRTFAKEKQLKLGEICAFELIKSSKTFNFYRNS